MTGGPDTARTSAHGGRPTEAIRVDEHRPLVRDVLPGVLEAAPTAVAVFRTDGSVAYRNDAWKRLIGGKLDIEGASDPVARALLDGVGSESEEREVRRRDGAVVRVLLTVTPLVDDDGHSIGVTAYAQSIDRVAAGALREAFLGVLSHELRTPITSIYGGSQLLLNDELSAGSRSEVLTAIAAEAEQLHRRVEDFLALARVERGMDRPEREPILLQRLIAAAVAAETRRSPGQRFQVRSAPDLAPAVGDIGQVGQILRNLLANATDASPRGRTVLIEVTQVLDCIQVVVKDRAPGAPKDAGLDDDVFSLFYRHPSTGGHVPRVGMGLYVARALVEANDGRIWLRARRGGGTEVGFTLPLYDLTREG